MLNMDQTPSAADEVVFYSVKDAAAKLGVSIWVVYELVGNGSIQATKIGKNIKIRPAWLEEYAASLPAYAPESA